MKEVILKSDEKMFIVKEFNNVVGVRKTKNAYYIFDLEQEIGPFLSVYYNIKGLGSTICGFNYDDSQAVSVGAFGFYELEKEDFPAEFRSLIRSKDIERVSQNYPDCEFVDDVHVYKLVKEEDPLWEKRDGYSRRLLPTKRYIFRSPEGTYFSVNPKLPAKSLEEYRFFDSFEEMQLSALYNKREYSDIQNYSNRYLGDLFRNLYYGRNLPHALIQKILNTIKKRVGIEEYRHLECPVDISIVHHKKISMRVLAESLKSLGEKNLYGFMKTTGNRMVGEHLIPFSVEKEIVSCVSRMPSFEYDEIKFKYKDVQFSCPIPYDIETQKKIRSTSLYEWKGAESFWVEQPEGFEEVVRIELKKHKKCIELFGEVKPTKPKPDPRTIYPQYFDFQISANVPEDFILNDDGESEAE